MFIPITLLFLVIINTLELSSVLRLDVWILNSLPCDARLYGADGKRGVYGRMSRGFESMCELLVYFFSFFLFFFR